MPREPGAPGTGRLAAVTLVAALGTTAGCASAHPFDVRFESGDYAAAARAFEADSALHDEPRALWRAAVIHATPSSDTYEPATARARLERLLARSPESEYAAPAAALVALLEEVGRMWDALAVLREQVDSVRAEAREVAAWHAALERARPGTEAYDPQGAREALGELVERHPDSRFRPAAEVVLALLENVARNRAAVAALQRQLDELKAVDLEDPPD